MSPLGKALAARDATITRMQWWQAFPGWRPRTHGACEARCGWQFMSDRDTVVRVQQPDGTFRLYCETCGGKMLPRAARSA